MVSDSPILQTMSNENSFQAASTKLDSSLQNLINSISKMEEKIDRKFTEMIEMIRSAATHRNNHASHSFSRCEEVGVDSGMVEAEFNVLITTTTVVRWNEFGKSVHKFKGSSIARVIVDNVVDSIGHTEADLIVDGFLLSNWANLAGSPSIHVMILEVNKPPPLPPDKKRYDSITKEAFGARLIGFCGITRVFDIAWKLFDKMSAKSGKTLLILLIMDSAYLYKATTLGTIIGIGETTKNLAVINHTRIIFDVKRLLGRKFEEMFVVWHEICGGIFSWASYSRLVLSSIQNICRMTIAVLAGGSRFRLLLIFAGYLKLKTFERHRYSWSHIILEKLCATAVLIHSSAYILSAPQRRLQPCQIVLCFRSSARAVDSVLAAELGFRLVHVNVPRAEEVADSSMALFLGLLRRTHWLSRQTLSASGWLGVIQPPCRGMRRCRGLVLGIVGKSAFAMALATRSWAFKMSVLYFDLHDGSDRVARAFPRAAIRMDTLNDLFAASDLVPLHNALTDETAQILNAESDDTLMGTQLREKLPKVKGHVSSLLATPSFSRELVILLRIALGLAFRLLKHMDVGNVNIKHFVLSLKVKRDQYQDESDVKVQQKSKAELLELIHPIAAKKPKFSTTLMLTYADNPTPLNSGAGSLSQVSSIGFEAYFMRPPKKPPDAIRTLRSRFSGKEGFVTGF